MAVSAGVFGRELFCGAVLETEAGGGEGCDGFGCSQGGVTELVVVVGVAGLSGFDVAGSETGVVCLDSAGFATEETAGGFV